MLLFSVNECFPQASHKAVKQGLQLIQSAPTFDALLDSLKLHDQILDVHSIDVMREALWQKYLGEAQADAQRKADFEAGAIQYAEGKTGLFKYTTKGATPDKGYPVYIALHGGGGGPKEMNDSQWEQMQRYYLKSIDTGIYVAPRGPNNTWNLHFDEDAVEFYGKLLVELRLLKGVDPNRIYILGYSAGGDGVYQLGPRFADQLAAVSMSAGHHNNISADNLQHLPMLLQVGELDAAYKRNQETVKYSLILDSLAKRFEGDFVHQVYVHAGKEHSYVQDHNGKLKPAAVIANPREWLDDAKLGKQTEAQTDAIEWLNKFTRNPYPNHLHWNVGASVDHGNTWFWLGYEGEITPTSLLEAHFIERENAIYVVNPISGMRIYFHEKIINPNKEISLYIGNEVFAMIPQPSLLSLAKTISVRNDHNFSFWQSVLIKVDEKGAISLR